MSRSSPCAITATTTIAHSHDHAQLVLGCPAAWTSKSRARQPVTRQRFAVVPAGAHHACASPRGSRCLVFDWTIGPC
jgi:hypothetical protein